MGDNMAQHSTESDIAVAEKEKIKEPSLYDIVLHDNDETSYEEVIFIVCKAFNLNHDSAVSLAKQVDTNKSAVCATYPREIAEMKLESIELIKQALASMIPIRSRQIMMLKFTIEKSSE
jgi:ATP-dependent Clp protease adaptor protein ClpS